MATEGALKQAAHAKINLTLHVTGQRPDGYHLLDSLVMFAQIGDVVTVAAADKLSLTVEGPYAAGLPVSDNLVLRAARAFDVNRGAAITLTKNLPVASGVGGGSSDAAATLRALSALWQVPLPDHGIVTSLGADVGVCMSRQLTRMSGIGEQLHRIGKPPPLHMLLVNPNIAVSTPAVFKALTGKDNAPMSGPMPAPCETHDWLDWLAEQRNDLQDPAIRTVPKIADVLAAINAQPGCQLARMSGSGATCFGLFATDHACKAATNAVSAAHPDWWVKATREAAI